MNTRPDTVRTELELRLVVQGASSLPVRAELRYDPTDPYAVHIAFHAGGDEVVEWTFARSLLSDGVTRPSGEGDVQVWPAKTGGRQVACLSLSSPSGTALFELPMAPLVEFMSRTYAAVAAGAEDDQVDFDAELALLLWTDPTL